MLTPKTMNRSHWIDLDFGNGIRKEEVYPIFTATIRGEERTIECSADRYMYHGGGLSDWRIYIRDVKPDAGIGPSTRRALNDEAQPLVSAWLAGAYHPDTMSYPESRRRAIYAAIAREVADSRYSDHRARQALATVGQELTLAMRKRLERSLRLQAEAAALLNYPETA